MTVVDAPRNLGDRSSPGGELGAAFRGKRIAFLMHPEEGHIVPTFSLAKWLRAAGSDVFFIGPLDFQNLVEREQLAYTPVLEGLAPRGYYAQWSRARWARARGATAPVPPGLPPLLLDLVARSEAEPLLRRLAPDLLCVDPHVWPFALVAQRLGLPVVSVQTDGVRRFGRFVLTSDRRKGSSRAHPAATTEVDNGGAPRRFEKLNHTYQLIARSYGFPYEPTKALEGDERWAVHEVALAPRCLALASPSEPARGYLGLGVD